MRSRVREAKKKGLKIGLVPTMGALHAGHGKLVERCRAESGFAVVSIFVNPTQFGPHEDYQRYPRMLVEDCRTCENAGADLVFAPEANTMYPRGGQRATFVEVPGLSDVLEGASRPGHFRGVATVVFKLFAICEPDLAYFGAKDYQQLTVIRRMVADLNFPVEVREVETVREADGLALSSRNRYLDAEQRRAARVLSIALGRAREVVASGERNAERVRQVLVETVESESLARLDYAKVVDAETLEPILEIEETSRVVGLVAAWIGTTRLIDNARLVV